MTFHRRLAVLGALALLLLFLKTVAGAYAHVIVAYVVEGALQQKAPAGTDPEYVRERMRELLRNRATTEDRLDTLISISQALEKVQRITPEELEHLLSHDAGARDR